jgi:hypothetical protein
MIRVITVTAPVESAGGPDPIARPASPAIDRLRHPAWRTSAQSARPSVIYATFASAIAGVWGRTSWGNGWASDVTQPRRRAADAGGVSGAAKPPVRRR